MDRDMVGFVALDESHGFVQTFNFQYPLRGAFWTEILGRFPRSMMRVSLEAYVGSDLLDDDSAKPASLGIPCHMVADLENSRHCF